MDLFIELTVLSIGIVAISIGITKYLDKKRYNEYKQEKIDRYKLLREDYSVMEKKNRIFEGNSMFVERKDKQFEIEVLKELEEFIYKLTYEDLSFIIEYERSITNDLAFIDMFRNIRKTKNYYSKDIEKMFLANLKKYEELKLKQLKQREDEENNNVKVPSEIETITSSLPEDIQKELESLAS